MTVILLFTKRIERLMEIAKDSTVSDDVVDEYARHLRVSNKDELRALIRVIECYRPQIAERWARQLETSRRLRKGK